MDFELLLEKIKELRVKYSQLPDYNEETIQVRIVKPLIEALGFKEDWHRYEYPVVKNKKITDITIKKDNKVIMVIEVKKGGNSWLKEDDFLQLLTYLHSVNVEWGIVTNGREYAILNRKIDGELIDMEVLRFNLQDISQIGMINYFTFNSLFETEYTRYFVYLAQFKTYKMRESNNIRSLSIYNSTISNYFNFLKENFNRFKRLEYLDREDFKDFIKHDIKHSNYRNKKINSKDTIFSKYRHISNLYDLFVKNKFDNMTQNPFRYITEDEMIKGIDGLKLDDEDYLEKMTIESFQYKCQHKLVHF